MILKNKKMRKTKLIILIFSLFLQIKTFSYNEQKEYIKVKEVKHANKIIEFFSFYCSHCYQFKIIQNMTQKIQKKLPKNIKIKSYHVYLLGPLGLELTKAWSIATILKIEKKIAFLIFQGIQKKTINKKEDIKKIFLKIGIKEEKYDTISNSSTTKSLTKEQIKMTQDFQLKFIPSIFIKGKYMILYNSNNKKNQKFYFQKYFKTINFLLNR